MKIGLTSIFVNDVSAAFRIYTEILGFKEVMFQPEMSLAMVTSAEDSTGTTLLLEPNDHPIARPFQSGMYESGLPALVLSSENLDKDFENLKENGISFRQEPIENEYGKTAIFDDKCGNLIQIHQNKP